MRRNLTYLLLGCMFCLFLSSCGGDSMGEVGGVAPPPAGDGGGGSGTLKWSTGIKGTPSGTAGIFVTPKFISSPALAPDGTVYVGSDDHFLYALNPDGTVKWKFETGNSLFASPAIGSDGTIYIGSEDRQFYAVNPDGTLKWIFPTKNVFTSSAAIAADGTIYAAGTDRDRTIFSCVSDSSCSSLSSQKCGQDPDCPTDQKCVPSQTGTGSFCAISQDIPCGEGFAACQAGQVCVAGLSAGFTLVAQLSSLFAINPDGTSKWLEPITISGVVNSSPAIASDGTIYIGSQGDFVFDRSEICNLKSEFPASDANDSKPVNGHLYAINPNGKLKWDFKTLGRVDSSPAIGSDGTIYVGSQHTLKFYGKNRSTLVDEDSDATGFIYAINPDRTLKCLKDILGDVDSSPAVGVDGTIYAGSDDFHVWALPSICPGNVWTENWVVPTRDEVKSSPAIAADGTIFVGSNDGSLYALNPDGTLKLRFDSTGSVSSSPSIGDDGTVYFASASGKGNNVNSNALSAIIGSSDKLVDGPWPKFRQNLKNTGRK